MARDDNTEPGDYMRISQENAEPEKGSGLLIHVSFSAEVCVVRM